MGIRRVYHVGVNCSDMQRSARFYSGPLGLRAAPVTIPGHLRAAYEPAIKKIMGMEVEGKVDFEAYFLAGEEAEDATYIDLIQWRNPRACGDPYERLTHVGIARVALLVEDVDAMYARVVRDGIACLSQPKTLVTASGEQFRCVVLRDPDGTVMEFVQTVFPTPAEARPGVRRLFHVNINCTDLERSVEFYGKTLGLTKLLETRFADSQDLGDLLDLGKRASANVCLFATEQGAAGTVIDLVEWQKPLAMGRPYAQMNHLGIPRMAFLVEDVDGMYETLSRQGVEFLSEPVTLQFEPPVGKIRAVCFRDPDGATLELLELNCPA